MKTESGLSIWDNLLTEDDRAVIDAAGYSTRGAATFDSLRTGTAPALLIIDMQRLFVGDDVPIHEAVQTEPTMIGERGWRAIDAMQPLIATCHRYARPIIYATMQPYNRPVDDPLLDIVAPLAPTSDDILLQKNSTSIFHETTLAVQLRALQCDSVILAGNSTSGCIRAAAVDAVQHNFGVYVPVECVFDRITASHKISLLDMWMKYGTVLPTAAMIYKLDTMHTTDSTEVTPDAHRTG